MTIWDSGHYEVEKWSDTEVKFVLHGEEGIGRVRAVPDEGPQLDDPSARAVDPHRSAAHFRQADAGRAGRAAGGRATTGRSRSSGTACAPSSSSRVGGCGPRAGTISTSRAAFPELADIGKFLGMTTCVLDGEVVALGEDGRPSFSRLQRRMHVANPREARRRAVADPVSFVAFDLLYIDGHSLLADELRRAAGAARVAAPRRGDLHHHGVLPRRVRRDILAAAVRERPRRGRRQAARLALPTRPTQSRTGSRSSRSGPRRW